VGRYLLSLARDKDVIMVNRQQIEWRNRNFLRGLAIGALVLTFFGAGWAIAPALLLTTSSGATALALIVVALITVALVVGCLALLRDAQRIPVDSSPKALARGRALGRRLGIGFGVVFGSEALFIALASIILSANGLDDFIVPVIALIVGLHFLPLAWLFDVSIYYVTGALISLVAIITVLAIPRTATVNGAPLWVIVPATGSAVVLWLTAAVALLLGRRAADITLASWR
jgi:hypothetical protein